VDNRVDIFVDNLYPQTIHAVIHTVIHITRPVLAAHFNDLEGYPLIHIDFPYFRDPSKNCSTRILWIGFVSGH
jgi:hypothetical protein